MEPKIKVGDVVIINKDKNINKNDIIAFNDGGIITVHRAVDIIEKDGETLYKTKGDNNNTEDLEQIKAKDVVGKCVFIIPFIGKIVIFIYNNF